MNECPVCSKDIPDGEKIQVTTKGECSVCGLNLITDTRSIEYGQTDGERARLGRGQKTAEDRPRSRRSRLS